MAGENGGPASGQDALDALKAALAGGAPNASSAKDPPLYLGVTPSRPLYDPQRDALREGASQPAADNVQSTSQAYLLFQGWSDKERQAWQNGLYGAGLLQDPADYMGAQTLWQKAVDESARYYAANKNISPWQVVGLMAGQANGKGLAKTTTNASTSKNLPSSSEANALVTKVYQDQLGRNPTDGELKQYRIFVEQQAKAHPQTTTTTQTTDGTGNSSSASTTSGGVDLGFETNKALQADPEYGAYQASTYYMNALHAALGSG